MTTRFIGIKELRQNMAKISNRAHKNKERVIVLRKNQPIFELRPLDGGEAFVESFRQEIEKAHNDVKEGRIYSQDTIEKKLGL